MKPLIFALCVAVSAAALRQGPVGPAVSATGAFAAFSVHDLAASIRWYSEKLDMQTVMSIPEKNGVAVTVLEGRGVIVELIQNDQAVPFGRAAPSITDRVLINGPFKVGAIVADFDATVALLRARGVEIAYGPYPARPDQRANVIVKDNEGNLIQFFGGRR